MKRRMFLRTGFAAGVAGLASPTLLNGARTAVLPQTAPRGRFRFNGNVTSNRGAADTGHPWASFLLGYARTLDRRLFEDKTYTETRPEYAFYVQDEWRVTPQLTAIFGLRPANR